MNKFFDLLTENKVDPEPKPNIAICSECGWQGPTSECIKDQEGDWESGYYLIDLCPVCEDGGCIDDYDMTPERTKEWGEWFSRKGEYKSNGRS